MCEVLALSFRNIFLKLFFRNYRKIQFDPNVRGVGIVFSKHISKVILFLAKYLSGPLNFTFVSDMSFKFLKFQIDPLSY